MAMQIWPTLRDEQEVEECAQTVNLALTARYRLWTASSMRSRRTPPDS